MWSLGVIVSLNILKDRELEFLQGVIGSTVGFFFFEIFKEAFTTGIVKGIALFRKRLHNIKRIQKLTECKSSILWIVSRFFRKFILLPD